MDGLSEALYGFVKGEYTWKTFHQVWKEKLYTPILNHYFKSVKVNGYLYSTIKNRRKQIGLL